MPRVPVSNYPTRGMGTRHPNIVNRTRFPLDLENLENHGKPGILENHGKPGEMVVVGVGGGFSKNLEKSFKTWKKFLF